MPETMSTTARALDSKIFTQDVDRTLEAYLAGEVDNFNKLTFFVETFGSDEDKKSFYALQTELAQFNGETDFSDAEVSEVFEGLFTKMATTINTVVLNAADNDINKLLNEIELLHDHYELAIEAQRDETTLAQGVANMALDALSSERDYSEELKKLLDKYRKAVEKFTPRTRDLNRRVTSQESMISELEMQLNDSEFERREMSKALKVLWLELSEMKHQNDKMFAEVQEQLNALTNLQKKVKTLTIEKRNLTESLKVVKEDRDHFKGLVMLVMEQMDEEIRQKREAMKKAEAELERQGQMKGVIEGVKGKLSGLKLKGRIKKKDK